MTEPNPTNSLLETIEPEAEKIIVNWEIVFDRVLNRLTGNLSAWATPDARSQAAMIALEIVT